MWGSFRNHCVFVSVYPETYSHFGLGLLCRMSDFPVISTQKTILILLPSGTTSSPRTAGNADDRLTHSETISQIGADQINMQRRAPCWPFPWMAFPSPAASCCPVTRCRGRQVYLVWQVTLYPEPSPVPCQADPHAQTTPPSDGGWNTIMWKCITHFYEFFSCIMVMPCPFLAGACRGMHFAWLTPL